MSKFRVGIIGCGKIFPMHAVSILKQKNAQLVSICDNKEQVAKERAKEYNCSYYTDYREMIKKENLDSVHICTPHYLHPEMAIFALSQGLHVLTEKPMAIHKEDAYRMQEIAKQNNRILMVSFQNRFNPGSLLIKKTLESKELGNILSARAMVTWNRSDEYYTQSDWKGTWDKEGGGVIIDQAIHTLDLMNWFIDSQISFVHAQIGTRVHHIIDVDDYGEGIVQYKNGVIASFFAINYYTYDAPIEIELHCEKGIAKLVGEKATITFHDGQVRIADRNPNETFDFGEVKQYWGVGHIKEITHFYHVLEHGGTMRNTAEEVMSTQEMICAIYESGKTGKAVHF